jgi:single-stranded-DNA-specific exonuclease
LLANRGYEADQLRILLSDHPDFHDPYLMDGMDRAVARIRHSIRNNEKILVYGDYDADGVSSTSLMIQVLRSLKADFEYFIPHRTQDGYGLHTTILEKARLKGVSLVITVDTGISAVKEADAANKLGLDLIITDHHEPPEQLPSAYALLNPKLPGNRYPFQGLAGVGVAFKLAHALLDRVPLEWAEYAALGTIADMMPMIGENRFIVKLGLERLRSNPNLGLAALLRTAGVTTTDATSETIAFRVAPRINAAGRLISADDAVRLLVTDDPIEADALANRLDALNKERQQLVETTVQQAVSLVEDITPIPDAIVIASKQWNPGVIGIVASRLVEIFGKPAVVIAIDPETNIGKGSARSIPGFHLYDSLKACSPWLEQFGGHESAAGLTVQADKLASFTTQFQLAAQNRITPEMKIQHTVVDAIVDIADVTITSIDELHKLAPFGISHPAPTFMMRNCQVTDCYPVGKDRKHVKMKITDGTGDLDAIGFGFGDLALRMTGDAPLELVGELAVNQWQGRKSPQLIIRDVSISRMQLLDWRDVFKPNVVLERMASFKSTHCRHAFLLGMYEDCPAGWEDQWLQVPWYRLDYDGAQPQPLNLMARQQPLFDCTDLFLVGCPFPYEQLQYVRTLSPNIGNIICLNDFTPISTPLQTKMDRAWLLKVYTLFKSLGEVTVSDALSIIAAQTDCSRRSAEFALKVFTELDFVDTHSSQGMLRSRNRAAKRELAQSPTYCKEMKASIAKSEWAAASSLQLRRWIMEEATHEHNAMEEFTR